MSSTHLRSGGSRPSSSGTTLSKMIDAAAAGKHNVKWSHVLHYLKAQCVISEDFDNDDSDEEKNHPFDVPFQRYYVASPELLQELSPSTTGQSVLRTAIAYGEVVPLSILQALCHLGPSAISHIDLSTGRMLVHTACRFPYPTSTRNRRPDSSQSSTIDAILSLLVAAYPVALLHRDNNGCTPLHYLFMYHARHRSVELCRVFTQSFPDNKHIFFTLRQPAHRDPPLPDIPRPSQSNKLPCNAAIVPDSIHGCIPIHYAVVNGASFEALQVLYSAYPASKHVSDARGRTPIHWYFGAGVLDFDHPTIVTGDPLPSWNHLVSDATLSDIDTKTATDTTALTDEGSKPKYQTNSLLQQQKLISNHFYPYDHSLDTKVVQLLLSSRVSRTVDSTWLRYPLHWICVLIAHKTLFYDSDGSNKVDEIPRILQLLLDSYAGQCSCQDVQGMTPISLLFDTVQKLQERVYMQQCGTGRTNMNSYVRKLSVGFTPPLSIVQMLVQVPASLATPSDVPADEATKIASKEDNEGRLPLHVALQVASSTEVVELLVSAYPASLVHTTTEEMFSPLHAAFSSDRTAHLQSEETVSVLLFHSYQAGKHGTTVDGRLAMKMEDSNGYFPIHYACQNGASAAVVELFVRRYSACALLQKPNGDLPLHCLVQNHDLRGDLISIITDSVSDDANDSETIHFDLTKETLLEMRRKLSVLIPQLLLNPTLLQLEDSIGGMLPLHIAVLFQSVDYRILLRMLKKFPDSALMYTRNLAFLMQSHGSSGSSLNTTSSANLNCFSALDLHDSCEKHELLSVYDSDEWYRIRELLFSFGPTLESHRHRQELLDHGVQIVLDELLSYEQCVEKNPAPDCTIVRYGHHYSAEMDQDRDLPDLNISHSVSAMEEALGIQHRRRRIRVSKRLSSNKSRHHPANRTSARCMPSGSETISSAPDESSAVVVDIQLNTGSSMYDDDDTGFFQERKSDYDDGSDTSYVSGDDSSSKSYASDDVETETDEYETHADESETKGSRSFYTTTSGGSRLPTTFEEASGASNDDSQTYIDSGTGADYEESTFCSQSQHAGDDSYMTSVSRRQNHRSRNEPDFAESCASRHEIFDDDSAAFSASSVLEHSKQNTFSEEKKHDTETDLSFQAPQTPKATNTRKSSRFYQRPSYLSEVGLRIWTFFVMYCDLNNPKDNYADKLARIVAEIKSETWDVLVSCPLPPFAKNYVGPSVEIEGMTFRDLASPKCRELIHKTKHFLGKYDFSFDRDILVYRTSNDDSVTVEASEWLYTTEMMTAAKNPGISEENIWSTGEVPAEIGLTFEAHKRPVWIKFTKNASEYNNEVFCRLELGISVEDGILNTTDIAVFPIFQHFSAIASERKHDKDYTAHLTDERFKYLSINSGSTNERKLQLLLLDYPFVIVYPSPRHGTLHDFYNNHGVYQSSECKRIICQVAHALAGLHTRGFCHGNVSMRSIALFSTKTCDSDRWGFFDLSYASCVGKSSSLNFLGGIDGNGFALFQTESLPPEMFMTVTSSELKQYWAYWEVVEQRFNVVIEKALLNPVVDLNSGKTYVAKCHFIPLTLGENDVPLPYNLVPADFSADIWALGQLLFALHTGRSLFHVSIRDGHLLDYSSVCDWDGSSLIYEYVTDFTVQDVLLLCLSSWETRKKLSISEILRHPYFSGVLLATKVLDERKMDSCTHRRRLDRKLLELSENKWLEERSVTVYCWNYATLEQFHHSPSEIIRNMLSRRKDIVFPCGFLVLPYNLGDLSHIEVVPQNVELFGMELLRLSQRCYFAVVLRKTLCLKSSGNTKSTWSSSELFQAMNLIDSFGTVEIEVASLAARHVELFRRDPMEIAMMLVQDQISRLLECFEGKDTYIYLIDEYSCLPVGISETEVAVSATRRSDLLKSVLPMMHLCLLYARGVSQGLDGLLKLLSPRCESVLPTSWINAGKGLANCLDICSWVDEVNILLEALQLFFSSQNGIDDCLAEVRDYLAEVDSRCNVGGLKRVVAGNTCLWTTLNGANFIEESCRAFTFFDALKESRYENK
jgi:serine/threonine protein kinase/ankyrin repeat protein